ncbi:flagellar basal body P-ring biosynthesis protein FlgA [Labrenzia sp. C1B10]|uniref:flagellar basal body P-ring formation chaperone FlgA n=1 Tax=unclassified Labrenzia TaxID=2648686 RepID=UPI0003B84C0A|nr:MULTISPECIES: flagellar basal body P-ring formation chaperone FlgA [unclassified Labrenzia]ERP97910.1 flagellar basal body P-ring biosynthesis protein FlgA [Labrenzia sp. C1B10]ERS01702.1 flagellar basal body P-ring biosynthesis protein FlgA [Labrenzia sp. C1B70]
MTIRSLFLVLVMIFSTGAAKAAGGIDLPVPRQTIPAGTEITHQDLIERLFPTRTAQQFAVSTNRGQLVGMVARRTLLPGQPVPINSVEKPVLVRRGEPARLVFREQGLVIIMQVEALQNGGAGNFVRVRNVDSGLVVSGRVQEDGTIRVEN